MRTVIVSGARTPFAKYGGGLRSLQASELGGVAIKEALTRANWSADAVDGLIMGSVLQAGQGQIPSRQAAKHAHLPWSVQTETINKVCASGMRSVTMADQIIRLGEAGLLLLVGWNQ
ncbi:3-ketoacyl-CoA thiolase [Halalkalibacter wakoensis JCM 9140]|uniref:acetyl-CoA C-acetyltransferase n=1 Tax=Halalkalibacter wakoensis JCM 9140 TaxID=1236970 RepID=W4Q574_9BACI|nr:3-ketoacyl-CoA thiolase [Halalkalibacter wakoensis JCM 9140]